jgi:hypothetical protein
MDKAMATEIERSAVTLLRNTHINHVGLAKWIEAMCKDPEENRFLDKFVSDNPNLIETMREIGYIVPDGTHRIPVFEAIWDCEPKGEEIRDPDEYFLAWNDAIALALAAGLRDYRAEGRPEGNQRYTIQGLGGPLATIETSLAAKVVEFHQQVKVMLNTDEEDLFP